MALTTLDLIFLLFWGQINATICPQYKMNIFNFLLSYTSLVYFSLLSFIFLFTFKMYQNHTNVYYLHSCFSILL
jgi:hypothetical protein